MVVILQTVLYAFRFCPVYLTWSDVISASMLLQVPNVETHVVDLTNWDVARQLVESLGPIDLLVNSAGTSDPQMFLDVTKESLDR